MKKKLWVLTVVGIVCAAVLWQCTVGRRPFETLTAETIAEVTVYLLPPNVEETLTEAEITELAALLQDVVIYNRTVRHLLSGGQTVCFTMTMTDGTVREVQPYGSVMILDGKGYRTEYLPSEALNQLANIIGNTQWAKK